MSERTELIIWLSALVRHVSAERSGADMSERTELIIWPSNWRLMPARSEAVPT